MRWNSPLKPLDSRDKIKVPVAAKQRERMLAAERCNPQVVRGDRLSRFLKLAANGAIADSGLFVYAENPELRQGIGDPLLVILPVA